MCFHQARYCRGMQANPQTSRPTKRSILAGHEGQDAERPCMLLVELARCVQNWRYSCTSYKNEVSESSLHYACIDAGTWYSCWSTIPAFSLSHCWVLHQAVITWWLQEVGIYCKSTSWTHSACWYHLFWLWHWSYCCEIYPQEDQSSISGFPSAFVRLDFRK